MKEVLKIKKDIESTTLTLPELERYIGKKAEITISIDTDLTGRARLRDQLMNNVAFFSSGASFLDAEARERFDFH